MTDSATFRMGVTAIWHRSTMELVREKSIMSRPFGCRKPIGSSMGMKVTIQPMCPMGPRTTMGTITGLTMAQAMVFR